MECRVMENSALVEALVVGIGPSTSRSLAGGIDKYMINFGTLLKFAVCDC